MPTATHSLLAACLACLAGAVFTFATRSLRQLSLVFVGHELAKIALCDEVCTLPWATYAHTMGEYQRILVISINIELLSFWLWIWLVFINAATYSPPLQAPANVCLSRSHVARAEKLVCGVLFV